jgi:hypothetical protein
MSALPLSAAALFPATVRVEFSLAPPQKKDIRFR